MLRRLADWRPHLAIAVTTALLLSGCADAPEDTAGAQVAREGAGEDLAAAGEPAPATQDDGTAAADERVGRVALPERSEPEPAPTFRDDDPLFAELPAVQVDPDNEPPEEFAPLLRELVIDGLRGATRMFASGRIDEGVLRSTHDAAAYDKVVVTIDELAAAGLVERTPDLRYSELVIDYRNHFTVWVHACVHPGPRSGVYDVRSRQMVSPAGGEALAVDLLVSRTGPPSADDPRFRIVDTFPQLHHTCG